MSRRLILRVVMGVVLVVVVGGALVFLTIRLSDLTGHEARDQQATITALCTFRDDLRQRERSGTSFLRKHPHGIPGIPGGVIRTSLQGQRRAIRALRALPCSQAK